MVKILYIMLAAITFSPASGPNMRQLQEDCLTCHVQQKVPSELIYRRYLAAYSVDETIKKKIAVYLQHPDKDASIMPAQFFFKFPMKEKIVMEEERLKQDIEAFLDYFDIKKKLILQE